MGAKHTEIDNIPGGILPVIKPVGMSSHDVVNRIRRLYGIKRVGHAGTLDPLACGVLIVLIGRAAKACEYISSDKKRYTARLRLGLETDTEDITGQVLSEYRGQLPSRESVGQVCGELVGRIMQTPPMYSALKVNGQKLYDLARRGVTVERQAREIEIYSLECTETDRDDEYILDVTCSGGTYIRTLCSDIGKRLGCGGVMAALERTSACGIDISQCYTLEELEGQQTERLTDMLLDTEMLFFDLERVVLPRFFERLLRDGCPIYQKKLGICIRDGERVRVCSQSGEFFALGEAGMSDGESIIRSVKIFKL